MPDAAFPIALIVVFVAALAVLFAPFVRQAIAIRRGTEAAVEPRPPAPPSPPARRLSRLSAEAMRLYDEAAENWWPDVWGPKHTPPEPPYDWARQSSGAFVGPGRGTAI